MDKLQKKYTKLAACTAQLLSVLLVGSKKLLL